MQSLLAWLSGNWLIAAVLSMGLIEFTPIKICPLSAALKWIGKRVNDETMTQLKELKTNADKANADMLKRIGELEVKVDLNEIDRIRNEVLDFANSCRNKRQHTKDEFEHVIALNEKYEELLEKYDKTNGVFTLEYEYIVKLYKQCQEQNDFL